MPPVIPQIVGFVAVVIFLLSFQQKTRGRIIAFNVTSRVLYIVQYLLLGAFSGAVLDALGSVSAVVAAKKGEPFIKKHLRLIWVVIHGCMVVAGIAIAVANKNWLDLFSLTGVLLHVCAFWVSDERIIRRVSLAGSPFWLVYDLLSRAYGSAVGDFLSICSILIAMYRYRHPEPKDDI